MEFKKLPISKIKLNPNNPRVIKDDKFKKLVASIKQFPKMLEIRPIVVNSDMIILGGNMRLRACQEAGMKEVPVIEASDLTPEEQREFIIKDNVGFGAWDWDMLANEWDDEDLDKWGLDVPDYNDESEQNDLSDSLNNEYRVEVICINEEEQERAYNEIKGMGYECRVLTL